MMKPVDHALPASAANVVRAPADGRSVVLDEAMDRYARGDDASFDELYRSGAPRVRGFLLRLCGDLALADDLTQETFLRAHRARGSFAVSAAALPWLLAIARNALRDHARRAQVRSAVSSRAGDDDSGGGGEAAPDTRGDEALAARELLAVVRATLERMPIRQREAFVLLRFEGLSVGEAAQVLGATEGAVKVRAFRAYEMLREALGEAQKERP
ncbi:MAG TPA: RNA polymerase sigma factor [Polyangiaceae bacterium]|nr:RNA polymerase sigma factor [Polyangiaceae bacterium]